MWILTRRVFFCCNIDFRPTFFVCIDVSIYPRAVLLKSRHLHVSALQSHHTSSSPSRFSFYYFFFFSVLFYSSASAGSSQSSAPTSARRFAGCVADRASGPLCYISDLCMAPASTMKQFSSAWCFNRRPTFGPTPHPQKKFLKNSIWLKWFLISNFF